MSKRVRQRPEPTSMVHRLDRSAQNDTQSRPSLPLIFAPFTLRGVTLKNRLVMAPMSQYSALDGSVGDWHLVHLGSRAIGGASLIVTEMAAPMREGRATTLCAGMYAPAHVRRWRRIVQFVHSRRSRICLQLGHAGRKGSTRRTWDGKNEPLVSGGWPLLSASPLPFDAGSPIPREMSRSDMDRVRDAFVDAARMADRADFDMIELHMAHGFLLASFLSPLTNVRTDEYGGDLEGRAAYPLEVFRAVRAAFAAEKPLLVRISATDWQPGGISDEEVIAFARMLRAAGCDLINVSTGQTTPHAAPRHGPLFQVPFSQRIRRQANIPTMVAGAITEPEQINAILLAEASDLVAMGRRWLCDPYFMMRVAAEAQDLACEDWPESYRAASAQLAVMLRTLRSSAS